MLSPSPHSRVLPRFEYHQPRSLQEAIAMLNQYGEKAKLIAGGTDILVSMRNHETAPQHLVGLVNIVGLDFVAYDGKNLKIGALTRVRSVEESEPIRERYMALHEAASALASVQIRNMATVGGNLCNASPAADLPPALIVLGAQASIMGPDGTRTSPLEDFFLGVGKTVLKRNEILTDVTVPHPRSDSGSAFLKMGRTAMDISKVNVAVCLTVSKNVCESAMVALGSVAPVPLRVRKAEEMLVGKEMNDDTIGETAIVASEETEPISDVRSTAEYRKEVAKVIVRRALRIAVDRVKRR